MLPLSLLENQNEFISVPSLPPISTTGPLDGQDGRSSGPVPINGRTATGQAHETIFTMDLMTNNRMPGWVRIATMAKLARLFASHKSSNGSSSHLLASIRHLCRSSNYKPRKRVETNNPCNPHTRFMSIPALPHDPRTNMQMTFATLGSFK